MNEGMPKPMWDNTGETEAPAIESVPTAEVVASEAKEKAPKLSYEEAAKIYHKLEDAVPDAEKLIFRERPASSHEERAIAKLELQIGAHYAQAEKFSQSGDPNGERAMRMLAQFKEAEKTILELYCDALAGGSDEFADIFRKEHPWLGGALEEGQVDEEETIEFGYDQAA